MDFLLKGLIIIYEEWGKGKICRKDQNFDKLPLPPPRNVNSKWTPFFIQYMNMITPPPSQFISHISSYMLSS